jgi:mRNA interferase ChpB
MTGHPDRGDIWHVDINPTKGREQKNPRYLLVLSPKEFNQLGTPLCAPITAGGDFARYAGFTVTLMGAGTQTSGVVLSNQVRVLDLAARKARFIERAPDLVTDEVIAKVMTLLE